MNLFLARDLDVGTNDERAHSLCSFARVCRGVSKVRERTGVVRCSNVSALCSRLLRCCTCFSCVELLILSIAALGNTCTQRCTLSFSHPALLSVDCGLIFFSSRQLWELAQDQPGGARGGAEEEEETVIPASRAMEIVGMLMAAHQLPAGR